MYRKEIVEKFKPGTLWFTNWELLFEDWNPSTRGPHDVRDGFQHLPEGALIMIVSLHEHGLWYIGLLGEKLIKVYIPHKTDFNPVQFIIK